MTTLYASGRIAWGLVIGLSILCQACHSGATVPVNVALADLPCASTSESGWESAPWFDGEQDPATCPWIEYPGNALLTLEHGLGRRPGAVLVYISFHSDGSKPSLATGDLAIIVEADATGIVLENRTRESFFLRAHIE